MLNLRSDEKPQSYQTVNKMSLSQTDTTAYDCMFYYENQVLKLNILGDIKNTKLSDCEIKVKVKS